MNTVYCIYREGIFEQGIYGIFSTRNRALIAAEKAVKAEPDDYHKFYLITRKMNNEGFEDTISREFVGRKEV